MDLHSCRGLKRLAVNPLHDHSHQDARHYSGDNVKQKVLHRRHLLILKLGGCPTDLLPHQPTAFKGLSHVKKKHGANAPGFSCLYSRRHAYTFPKTRGYCMALSFSDIRKAAELIGVEPCAVQAVVDAESGGSGFLPDGRPKILFEGHVFWKELQKRGIDPAPLASKYPGVIYPKWDRSRYKGGTAEWERLNTAALVNKEAALCSASYGLFQIMGFNHRAAGFGTVRAFVDAQKESEARQLESFCAYMRSEGLVPFLVKKDWAGFARRYNGPGYAANHYDSKLREAYGRCKSTL